MTKDSGHDMIFCSHCGRNLAENAQFCAFCGEKVPEIKSRKPEPKPKEPSKPERKLSPIVTFDTLAAGDEFQGFRITELVTKDEEGIKYLALKNDIKYVLKVFHKSRLANPQKVYALQLRLQGLLNLNHPNISKTDEASLAANPGYMATRYVQGISLDRLKKEQPEELTEDLIRKVAIQLMQAAKEIRKQGLSLNRLSSSGMMLDENNNLVLLSSTLHYEENDEREDIFHIGAVLARLACDHPLANTLYGDELLSEVKFRYIPGITISFNKVLAECLHRNILQRYTDTDLILEHLRALPRVEDDEVCNTPLDSNIPNVKPKNDMPKAGPEWAFIALVALAIIIVGLFMFTNLFSILFRGSDKPFSFTGFLPAPDTLKVTKNDQNVETTPQQPTQTEYGALKSTLREGQQYTFDRYGLSLAGTDQPTPPKQTTHQAPMPSYMVRLDSGSFGFGRLKENLNHNVSLNSFYISRHEVTQGQWNKRMTPANVSTVGDHLPVDNVSWTNIILYCNAISKADGLEPAYTLDYSTKPARVSCNFSANGWRLPTEAEWEFAAKAGALFDYSGSDDPEEVAWYRDNSAGRIRAPGGKNANANGLYDMSGNVSEWCWDWYDASYTRSIQQFINPSGPSTGTQRVIRGGNVMNGEGRNLNIIYREKGSPNKGIPYVGFRLVRSK
ncbi:MAG TPA: SUMF1/EgtB/PvdO family nonheme iron enzyme [Candidatus Cloacimonadota bacterium]|nr:SUMF1/EgtB/PvdO family nonheme iron enzyme [Candidatus Cloacimonadota bacterium]